MQPFTKLSSVVAALPPAQRPFFCHSEERSALCHSEEAAGPTRNLAGWANPFRTRRCLPGDTEGEPFAMQPFTKLTGVVAALPRPNVPFSVIPRSEAPSVIPRSEATRNLGVTPQSSGTGT